MNGTSLAQPKRTIRHKLPPRRTLKFTLAGGQAITIACVSSKGHMALTCTGPAEMQIERLREPGEPERPPDGSPLLACPGKESAV